MKLINVDVLSYSQYPCKVVIMYDTAPVYPLLYPGLDQTDKFILHGQWCVEASLLSI